MNLDDYIALAPDGNAHLLDEILSSITYPICTLETVDTNGEPVAKLIWDHELMTKIATAIDKSSDVQFEYAMSHNLGNEYNEDDFICMLSMSEFYSQRLIKRLSQTLDLDAIDRMVTEYPDSDIKTTVMVNLSKLRDDV